jgi:hypothetical protein
VVVIAVELATGYVRLLPSARGFQAAIDKEIGGDLRRSGEKAGDDTARHFGGKFNAGLRNVGKAAAIGLAGAITGAAVIGKQAVDAASNLEEAQNRVNVVFGDGADAISAWAKTASRSIGQSESDALAAAGSFGNLFTQLGIGGEAAADMSTQMVTLASDFASFHNADITDVIEAQSAAFRGEYDSLQRFVPTINAAAVEQRALEMGLAATTGELDAQDKALATQALIMEGAGQAAGDFARTSDGLANQQRISQARFEELSATLGQVLIPVISKVLEVAINFADVIQRNWPKIEETFERTVTRIQEIWAQYGQPVLDVIMAGWRLFGDEILSAVRSAFEFIQRVVKGALDVIGGIIKTVTSIIKGDWGAAWEGIKQIFSGVWEGIKAILRLGMDNLKNLLSAGWSAVRAVFEAPALALWHFLRDRVIAPIVAGVTTMKDTLVSIWTGAVNGVMSVWRGIVEVYNFFMDRVIRPIRTAVADIRDTLGDWFGRAVDGIKAAWDRLRDVVKTPINLVIGFYNTGIRGVWNAVISKIPGVGDLPEISRLNSGGWVPGQGNRDTVPAMLTPGEFVVTKRAAKAWGPGVLQMLNNPNGTVDPGIFGYATGGYVRSADEALAWARAQAGKRYRFPDVGPDTYDCSGFTSALINFILGRYPHSRRHSSGSMSADPALRPGDGGNPMGGLFGARPPYMTNAQGARVGHTTATLMGVNMEATPPAVRVGGAARGAHSLTQLFHLPGYGGLSDADKAIVTDIAGLRNQKLEGLQPPIGNLLQTMFNRLPGMIIDFFLKKLPGMIVDAVRDVFTPNVTGSVAFANGGVIGRNGPTLVGERGPEWLWGSRGQYVEANGGAGGRQIVINNNHAPFDLDRAIRQARMLAA